MKILHALLVSAALFVLPGCAAISSIQSISSASVSPQQVIVAANAFDAIEITTTNYLRLPPCPQSTIVCRDQSTAVKLAAAIRKGRVARNQMEAYIANPAGQPVPVSGYNALTLAVSTAQSLLAN
jgi:hypothetical protein